MGYFSNKCAVISGAGDGIGRELAVQLNAQGCDLFLCDINEERLSETTSLLSSDRGAIDCKIVDCGMRADITEWADSISQCRSHVDALFNNAGVAYGARACSTARSSTPALSPMDGPPLVSMTGRGQR